MNVLYTVLILPATAAFTACATTPEQKAARVVAQKRYEQNPQIFLAAQCDRATAKPMHQQFEQVDNLAPPTAKQKEFRLKYVDKAPDPVFQACYKVAWQNYITQQQLREACYYYDDWGFYHPFYQLPLWWQTPGLFQKDRPKPFQMVPFLYTLIYPAVEPVYNNRRLSHKQTTHENLSWSGQRARLSVKRRRYHR